MERRNIIYQSLKNNGLIILTDDIKDAFHLSNAAAPEHCEICTVDPIGKLSLVRHAGAVFLGDYTPEPLGDYMAGPNHVLPTGGTAKFYSGLGVYDFIKRSSYSFYPREALSKFRNDVIKFAEAEGLDAHANAVKVRFE